jgi:hypothetical protein
LPRHFLREPEKDPVRVEVERVQVVRRRREWKQQEVPKRKTVRLKPQRVRKVQQELQKVQERR